MNAHLTRRIGLLTATAALAAFAAGGIAYAAIPDANGVFHGCFNPSSAKATGGAPLKIIDNASASCSNGEQAISWNQKGPTGPQGPQGQQGSAGERGQRGGAGPTGPTGLARTDWRYGQTNVDCSKDPCSAGSVIEAQAFCPVGGTLTGGGGAAYFSPDGSSAPVFAPNLALVLSDTGFGGDWTVIYKFATDVNTGFYLVDAQAICPVAGP